MATKNLIFVEGILRFAQNDRKRCLVGACIARPLVADNEYIKRTTNGRPYGAYSGGMNGGSKPPPYGILDTCSAAPK